MRCSYKWLHVGAWSLALPSVLALGLVLAESSVSLPAPWKQVQAPEVFSRNRSFPRAGNGYLLSFTRQVSQRHASVVALTSLADGRKKTLAFRFPEPETVVEDAAVAGDGHILLAVSYVQAVDAKARNFVVELDQSGQAVSTVDLGSYALERICAAPDGTFWTMGQEREAEQSANRTDYALLRNYALSGELRGSYFHTNQFPPDVNFHQEGHAPAYLGCGDVSVGAYVRLPYTAYWVEVQTGTGVEHQWKVATIPSSRMTGLTLLSEHTVYASFITKGRERGLYGLTLGAQGTASWARIRSDTGSFARLLGRDGPSLVYVGTAGPGIYWSRP